MSDLTDDDLELAVTVGDRLRAANRRAYVDRDTLNLADRLQRAALELQRNRAAVAADRERIRTTVADLMIELIDSDGPVTTREEIEFIASRAADQLATSAVRLTDDERKQLEHHIRDHRVTCSYSCSIIERLMGKP